MKKNYYGDKWYDTIFQPLSKTIIFFVNTVLIAVLCSGLVAEITSIQNGIEYSRIFHTKSIKPIILYLLVIGIYQFISYRKEKNLPGKVIELLDMELEEERMKQIIEGKCLESIAQKYKHFANEAKSIEELEKVYNSLKGGR